MATDRHGTINCLRVCDYVHYLDILCIHYLPLQSTSLGRLPFDANLRISNFVMFRNRGRSPNAGLELKSRLETQINIYTPPPYLHFLNHFTPFEFNTDSLRRIIWFITKRLRLAGGSSLNFRQLSHYVQQTLIQWLHLHKQPFLTTK